MTTPDPYTLIVSAREHTRAGRLAEAELLLRELLALAPAHPEALHMLAAQLQQRGRTDEASQLIEYATSVLPNDPILANMHAVLLADRGNPQEAAAIWSRLAHAYPEAAEYAHNLGRLAHQMGRFDDAAPWYEKALALEPGSLNTIEHYSDLLRARHQFTRCAQVLQGALHHFPTNASLHLRLSYALMMSGDLAGGWREFEWRWHSGDSLQPHQSMPEWHAHEGAPGITASRAEPLHGKTILLYAERRISDTIQFIRYAPLLAAQGARVIVECHPEIKPLLLQMPALAAVRAHGEPLPPFHFQLPLLSLPRAFGTTLDSIPVNIPYLAPDARKIATWARRLGPVAGKRVGIAWAGNPRNPNDSRRSVPLQALAPLAAIPGIEWISLQKGRSDAPPPGMALQDHGKFLTTLEETAALLATLDLVIAVDSAVAHLAGAMNRPTWLLLPDLCDWRWMDARADSPWYPSMRLFRQSAGAPGNWSPVIAAVAQALHSGH